MATKVRFGLVLVNSSGISRLGLFRVRVTGGFCQLRVTQAFLQTFENRDRIIRESGILSGEVRLLPIQEWFWSNVTNKSLTKPSHFNQSFLICASNLDKKLLEYSIKKLIEYHDAFRLNYSVDSNGNYIQYYSNFKSDQIKINYLYLSKHAIDKQENYLLETLTKWQSEFDLLNQSKGLIFPVLWHEPFGLAITESLFYGCPIFGTPYGALPEIVQSEYGFLSNDSKELINAIKEVKKYFVSGYRSIRCRL